MAMMAEACSHLNIPRRKGENIEMDSIDAK